MAYTVPTTVLKEVSISPLVTTCTYKCLTLRALVDGKSNCKKIFDYIQQRINIVQKSAVDAAKEKAIRDARAACEKIAKGVMNAIVPNIQMGGSWAASWQALKGAVSSAGGKLKTAVDFKNYGDLYDSKKNSLKNDMNVILDGIEKELKDISAGIKPTLGFDAMGLLAKLKNARKNGLIDNAMKQMVKDKIKSMGKSAKTAFDGTIQDINKAALDSLSRGSMLLANTKANIAQGLCNANSIDEFKESASNSFASAVTSMEDIRDAELEFLLRGLKQRMPSAAALLSADPAATLIQSIKSDINQMNLVELYAMSAIIQAIIALPDTDIEIPKTPLSKITV